MEYAASLMQIDLSTRLSIQFPKRNSLIKNRCTQISCCSKLKVTATINQRNLFSDWKEKLGSLGASIDITK